MLGEGCGERGSGVLLDRRAQRERRARSRLNRDREPRPAPRQLERCRVVHGQAIAEQSAAGEVSRVVDRVGEEDHALRAPVDVRAHVALERTRHPLAERTEPGRAEVAVPVHEDAQHGLGAEALHAHALGKERFERVRGDEPVEVQHVAHVASQPRKRQPRLRRAHQIAQALRAGDARDHAAEP